MHINIITVLKVFKGGLRVLQKQKRISVSVPESLLTEKSHDNHNLSIQIQTILSHDNNSLLD